MAFGSGAGEYDDQPFLVPRSYNLPELSWEQIAGRLERLTISIVHFDARLEASGNRILLRCQDMRQPVLRLHMQLSQVNVSTLPVT